MIIFLEKNNKLECISSSDIPSVLLSIARYKYFYKKMIVVKDFEVMFDGIDLEYYEANKNVYIDDVEVFVKLNISKIELEQKKEKQIKLTPQYFFDFFIHEYEKKYKISYIINNKFFYLRKFRKLMDEFYKNNLKDIHIKNYIKRCVYFGNHKGEIIYIDFLFNDKVLQNYLLFVKGVKDIDAVWPYLDTSISQLERKKIRYLMNLRLFDNFSKIEKILCLKLYKKYNLKVYEKLIEKYKIKEKVFMKQKVFELLCEDYSITMQELLEKTKHTKDYFLYEYTKKQIKEAIE